jgi:hypothetical protein
METENKLFYDQELQSRVDDEFERQEWFRKNDGNSGDSKYYISPTDCAKLLNEMTNFVSVIDTWPESRAFDNPNDIAKIFKDKGKDIPEWFAEKYKSILI